ncbi:coiled-coil domain-containing protein 15 isoform X3 [Tachysurus fulvidraco]|uniref:coiled-coil domain-containing protein 15 isoform X3 n=1 Tax=Tachysurus fulvidraco TaxID=1234273 RepID=UPI001FEFAAE6|nr:coiled-coil domain-containing protein 15 isoform X3 [Tachysurus fulvidraco]
MSQPRNNKKRETNQGRVKIKDGGQILNTRTWRKQREMRVLAERNPAVVPVGVWVESGDDEQEHPAVRASLTEELLEETRRTKEESLRQFQDAVRRRVSEQARIRKQQQLQKAYKIVERECREFPQSGDVVHCLTPKKSPFPPWPQGDLAVGSPNARRVKTQELKSASSDDANQYRQLSRIMKQVRHRLAACQTVTESKEFSELPGGIWKVSPTRDKTVRRITEDDDEDEEQEEGNEDFLGDEEEVLLVGQHDRPLCLQNGKTVTFRNDAVRERVLREAHPTSLDRRAAQVLWPREDQEEQKREVQNIYSRRSQVLMCRRQFMDVEREQAKEHQRRKKHLRRIARYVEALRSQIREKLEQEKVELPPLCSCGGESFWNSHPDTCANNCIFYNNPKAYAQALHSVLLSCEPCEGGAGPGGLTRKIVHTLAHNSSNFI